MSLIVATCIISLTLVICGTGLLTLPFRGCCLLATVLWLTDPYFLWHHLLTLVGEWQLSLTILRRDPIKSLAREVCLFTSDYFMSMVTDAGRGSHTILRFNLHIHYNNVDYMSYQLQPKAVTCPDYASLSSVTEINKFRILTIQNIRSNDVRC